MFDTNFVMILVEKSSYIIEGINRLLDPVIFVVPSCVKEELLRLSHSRYVKKSKISSLALCMVQSHMKVIETPKEGSVDDRIIAYARNKDNVFIATMDRELRKRLVIENLKCITLSNNKVVLC